MHRGSNSSCTSNDDRRLQREYDSCEASVQGSYQAFQTEKDLDNTCSFAASQNKLLQSYVDQTVTITKLFQPHLPLYVATVDGRGGDSGMDR
jgi:hypothetical protein